MNETNPQNKPNNPQKPFKPKFNFYWIYLAIALFFIASYFLNNNSQMSREVPICGVANSGGRARLATRGSRRRHGSTAGGRFPVAVPDASRSVFLRLAGQLRATQSAAGRFVADRSCGGAVVHDNLRADGLHGITSDIQG